MKTLTVCLNQSYDIHIGKGLFENCGAYLQPICKGNRIFIISDSNVFPLYGKIVESSLCAAGFHVHHFIFPAGEQSKRFETINEIVCAMAECGMTRTDTVAALGGGVTGDMAGFAAAIYMRGIDFVQLSTSLLSDIDSSVGGKTGCDLAKGKNLIGSFHQPHLVLIDTGALQTLDPHFFADGMGEAIKYALIRSPQLFQQLSQGSVLDMLEDLIYTCVAIKKDIVEKDEFEKGDRKLLNFGHTLGHAIEQYYNYETYTHGEAVAIGMVMITKAAEKNGLAVCGLTDQIINLLQSYHLPTACNADLQKLLQICLSDKKRRADHLDLVIVPKIGHAVIHPVKTETLASFFEGVC